MIQSEWWLSHVTSESSVPKLNVGNQTALHEKEAVNDFIDKGDDMSEVVNSAHH